MLASLLAKEKEYLVKSVLWDCGHVTGVYHNVKDKNSLPIRNAERIRKVWKTSQVDFLTMAYIMYFLRYPAVS